MKISGLKELTDKDLQERLSDERQIMENMRFQHAISGLESPVKLRGTKRNIARLLTEINGRRTNNKIAK